MKNKNGFGKTHHNPPAPFIWNYHDFEAVFILLEDKVKTGLDKITKDRYRSILLDEYTIIKRKIENRTYKFSRFKKVETRNGRTAYIPTIRDRIIIEYLKTQLEKSYKPIYPNREDISNLLLSKLTFGQEFYIFRYDIKSFFSSIQHQILIMFFASRNSPLLQLFFPTT